jgi:hypothetical protein
MPNQLAESKKRKTVAEHAAVLAMLDRIAAKEHTTSTELLRKAARDTVRRYEHKAELADVLSAYAPKLPNCRSSSKELARFKRECREYDALAMALGLRQAEQVQADNSLHRANRAPVLIGHL